MDLSAIRTEITNWITAETSLKSYWRARPNSWQAQTWIELRIASPRAWGRDALDYREDGDNLYLRQRGLRVFTLEIQIWSHAHADDKDSLHYTELLRNSLGRYEFSEIAFGSIQSTVLLDEVLLNRDMSVAQMDVTFFADASSETAAPTTWIETVDMDGTVDPAGDHITGEFP